MALFPKAALAAVFLGAPFHLHPHRTGTPFAAAEDLVVDPDGAVDGDLETATPREHDIDSGATLLVSFADAGGLANIEAAVAQHKGQGKGVELVSTRTFNRPHTPGGPVLKGASRAGSQGGGPPAGKGSNRRLQGTASSGYAVVKTAPGTTDEEAAALAGLDGVTTVEPDAEMTVDDVRGLRGKTGGAEGHVREIADALRRFEGDLPHPEEEAAEFAPTAEGDAHRRRYEDARRRRLAEQTPYGINMVNVSHLWDLPPKKHVTICVVDTGYQVGHEDLPVANVTGWHPINSDGSTPQGIWDVDGHGHGTHCAGTIGAIGNNGVGVVGVNPDPARFSFRIGKGLSDSGSGSTQAVMDAVFDCRDNGADVISMSLGSPGYVSAFDNACQEVYDDGVLVIAAAGNTYADSNHYPSGYQSVMSVASVTESGPGAHSSFSTRNQQVEIAAPGSAVLSTLPLTTEPTGYKAWSGTSMATPHVAGVAALLISHFPECTNNQIRNAMIHTTTEPPNDNKNSPGWDKYYGWGIVNAGQAYEMLSSLGCEGAGGTYPDAAANETLSMMAKGGQDQKQVGCLNDDQCQDLNLCLGEQKCDLSTNTCYVLEGTTPNCDDGKPCTIDTCDPSIPIVNGIQDMCVHTPKQCEDGNMCNGVYVCEDATGNCIVDTPAVDCNDGDACTIDTCVTSTGQCQYTDLTCNDANECTLDDHCNSLTGCVFAAPEPNCCGNAECEAGESEATCPQDCSDSITTTLDPNTAYRGYLGTIFNIATKSKNMTITGLGIHCSLPASVTGTAHVYTLADDYYSGGNWYSKSRWSLAFSGDVQCAGLGEATQVTFQNLVNIGKNSRQAFNIYMTTPDIDRDYPYIRAAYGSGGRYAVYAEDSYIAIEAGSGNRCTSGFCAISTPIAYSGTVQYAVVDDAPTTSPTLSNRPTDSFTNSPTDGPTESPTESPSTSLAPTPFNPEIVELETASTSSLSVMRAAYFEVQGGAEWAKITDLKLTTYNTKQVEVYFKYGSAAGFEKTPCAWQKVAETSPSWNPGYWKKVYPPWVNGFKAIVLPPNEKVSLYVVNVGNSYGILGTGSQPKPFYSAPWISLDATSPVGAVSMSSGRNGYNDQRFKPYPDYYSAYAIYGGVKLETMPPGVTEAPTAAPTEMSSPGSIVSPISGSAADPFNGLQFDVSNVGTQEVIVNKLSVIFQTSGTKQIEVWSRKGSHKGFSSGCDNWNNYCGQWTKLTSGSVYSGGSTSSTSTPSFVADVIKPGETTSFAVVSGSDFVVTRPGSADDVVNNGDLQINLASAIEDYHGDNVQSVHELTNTDVVFEGIIDYDIANSNCAALSMAPWVILDPTAGASSLSDAGEGEFEVEEVVHKPDHDGGGVGGPADGGEGPVEDFE